MNKIKGATQAQQQLLDEIINQLAVTDEQLGELSQQVYQQQPLRVFPIKSTISQDIRQIQQQPEATVALGMFINTMASQLKISSLQFLPSTAISEAPPTTNKQVFFLQDLEMNKIAQHVAEFINSHNLVPVPTKGPLKLGVAKDRDLDIKQLEAALLKQHLPAKLAVTINNAIATLVAARYRFPPTTVSLVLNHGVNVAYFSDDGAVNTELGQTKIQATMWDNMVDRESDQPGERQFEKLVADRYLGEIVRNLICDFIDRHLIFQKNTDSTVFSKPYSFFSSYVAVMEDSSAELSEAGDLLRAAFNVESSFVDRQIVKRLCQLVTTRAARLVGAALAGIVKRQDGRVTVSVSGILTEMNHQYVQTMMETTQEMLENQHVLFNVLGEEAFTLGAALAALI